jgi:hypothetical protein
VRYTCVASRCSCVISAITDAVMPATTSADAPGLSGKKQGIVNFKLPIFFLNKKIESKVHVDETTLHADTSYDKITGRDLVSEPKLVLDFDTQCITWDNID